MKLSSVIVSLLCVSAFGSTSGFLPKTPLTLTADTVMISLPDATATRRVVFGSTPLDATKKPYIVAAISSVDAPLGLTPLPTQYLHINENSVTFPDLPKSMNLVVFVAVPDSFKLQILSTEKQSPTIFTAGSRPLTLNGLLQDAQCTGLSSLLSKLGPGGGAVSAEANYKAMGNGSMQVNQRELKAHLLALAVPSISAEEIPINPACKCPQPILVKVSIDEAGNVSSYKYLGSSSAVNSAIGSVVSQWKFSPFIDAGAPVKVESLIVFFKDHSNNRVLSSSVLQ